MSARDDLLMRLGIVAGSYSPQRDRELIDAFEHELANKIRDESAGAIGDPLLAMHYAADLIDPKKWIGEQCPYVWGSHGCGLPVGHEGDHWCDHRPHDFDLPGETRPRGHADVWHHMTHEKEQTVAREHDDHRNQNHSDHMTNGSAGTTTPTDSHEGE